MALELEVETLSSRYLWIERNGETILVSYRLSLAMTLGSKIREKNCADELKPGWKDGHRKRLKIPERSLRHVGKPQT
jgi:hypothetical protein